MARSAPHSGVSAAQKAALEKGAFAIATNTTVPHEIVHHYLSGEDLANLEHASAAESSPWFFLFLGAFLGNAVPLILAIGDLMKASWKPSNLQDLTPVVPLVIGTLFLGGTIAFGVVAWRMRGRTVVQICEEIRKRARRNGGT